MIKILDNSDTQTSLLIFGVFQSSYRIEAELLSVESFPPLSRTATDIQNATTLFYGYYENDGLAAVAEITLSDQCVEIDSFTVSPSHFRKGIANKLLSYILKKYESLQAIVETAVANTPAINLYKKHGFVEFKRWTPSHGIPKVAMRIA